MKFYKGLRTDTAHVDQPQDSYRRARNILLDHTTMSVRTEGALDLLTPLNTEYTIGLDPNNNLSLCGIISLPQDRQLAILYDSDDDNHDLVLLTPTEYSLLASVSGFAFSPDNPIKGVSYENSREEVIVVWTDGVNRPVYTNLNADTITVYDLFPDAQFPNMLALPTAGNKSGSIDNGTYSFFIAYEVDADNLTTFSPSYGVFKVGHGRDDKVINTTVGMRFAGLDTSFDTYRIYCIHERNGVRQGYYLDSQSTSEDEFLWTGQIISRTISLDQLTVPPGWYDTVESLAVLDDRLYAAGLTQTSNNFDGQAIADDITLHWSIDGTHRYSNAPKYDHAWNKQWGLAFSSFLVTELDKQRDVSSLDHYGTAMGFMPGCAYAFYISFLLKNGTWTEGYPIPAGTGNADPTVDLSQDPQTLLDSSIKLDGVLGSVNNGTGTYLHVMPSVEQVHQAWGFKSTDGGNTDWAAANVGIAGRDVNIPDDVQDLIQGYSFFYAKPNANTRNVLAYTMLSDVGNSAVSTDVYLEANKPQFSNGQLTCVYRGNNLGYYTPTVTDTNYDIDGVEYLPGNSTGIENDNDNRENRHFFSTTPNFNSNTGFSSSVFGGGAEGSLLKFGTTPNEKWADYPYVANAGSAFANGYWMVSQTPVDWYDNLDQQQLVACSHIEKSFGNTTSSRISWGGDCIITPNRYRVMSTTASDDTNEIGTGVKTRAYFTYSYALQEFEDLTDPNVLTEQQILLYETTALNYAGSPEIMNPAQIPGHIYKKNVDKSAFASSDEDPVFNFPNRVIRSAKQNYESNAINWRTFAIADYYDNALNKGPISNIESYAGELIIHHTDGLFKTVGKETLDTSGSSVFVGSGDIFRSPPQELMPTEEGYAGLHKHTDAMLTKAGYVFVDAYAGKVFKLDSQLSDLSAKGMRRYFREQFVTDLNTTYSPYSNNGYAIGYDPVFDRILISCLQGYDTETNLNFQTISYSVLHDCWASNHTYPIQAFFTNRTNFGGFTGARFGLLNVGDNEAGAYIEPIFNTGGTTPKIFQSFQWVTRSTEGEGDWTLDTFDQAIVYNDRGCSGERNLAGNIRWVEEAWNFNDFRNVVAVGEEGNNYFDAEGELIVDIDITKAWYLQQRIRGGYAGIRLILLPSEGTTLYLSEALAKFRVSYR